MSDLMRRRSTRVLLAGASAFALLGVAAVPSSAAGLVSQATAQGLNAQVLGPQGINLALSNPPTSASNDGTQTNAPNVKPPILNVPLTGKFLQVGAILEAAEANQDGTSYACAGTASPQGQIQVGVPNVGCTITDTGKGGVTLDLGKLLGLKGNTDIKIVIDAVTAHGFLDGTNPAVLSGNVAGVSAQIGAKPLVVIQTSNAPNTDLLAEVLGGLFPGAGPGGLSGVGQLVSNILRPLISLTTNYQPAPEPNASGTWHVSGLHLALLGTTGIVNLANVTVGPNTANGGVPSFSFGNLPIVLAGLAVLVLIGFGVRTGVRRVRSMV